ncbi:MAG TPA: signal peptidase I [Chloroflexota bacterium]|jgi:signal peptidase I
MTELSGSLAGIPVESLIRFLGSLEKSGDAWIWLDVWVACLSFDRGRLIGAAVEHDTGERALDFIASAMGRAAFDFCEGTPTLEANFASASDPVARCARVEPAEWAAELPHADDVPCLLGSPGADDASETLPVPLARATVGVLLDVDGQRSVRSIARQHGLLRTLLALDELRALQLISFEPRPDEAPFAATSVVEALPDGASVPVADGSQLAERLGKLRQRVNIRAVLVEVGQTIVSSALLIAVVHALIQNFRIDGISMQPTFAAGEALIVDRTAYFKLDAVPFGGILPIERGSPGYVFGGPRRGDVVVFRAPPQPDVDYIKRVIGLPGESVLVRDQRVYVNGLLLDEPYIRFPANYMFPGNGEPLTIPVGTYFVLGDNRPDSFDSHTGWVVPAQNLIGRAWLRYWPPSAWGVVGPGGWSLVPPESASNPQQ